MTAKPWYHWPILALQRAPELRGRASRAEYWWFTALFLILGFDVSGVVYLALCVPAITVTVRRLHDLGWSGWWAVLAPLAWNAPFAIGVFREAFSDSTSATVADWPKLAQQAVPLLLVSLSLLSVVSAVAGVLLLRRAGTPGDNRFGPDPLACDAPRNP